MNINKIIKVFMAWVEFCFTPPKLKTFSEEKGRRRLAELKITRAKLKLLLVLLTLRGQTGKSDANIESKLMTSKIEV